MAIKATRPGSGSAGMSIEQHMEQARSEGHMFPSDIAITRYRAQQGMREYSGPARSGPSPIQSQLQDAARAHGNDVDREYDRVTPSPSEYAEHEDDQ